MILLIFSCLVSFFILFTFGDIFIRLYLRFSNRDENYSPIEIFLLGMCFVTLLVSVTSFRLPANHYVTIFLFAASVVYWICLPVGIQHLKLYAKQIKDSFNGLSPIIISLQTVFILFILLFPLCGTAPIDSLYYYQQGVMWNEQYAVIPGLTNLDERLGNNSNTFLVSAIFTFRFITGEPVFIIHVLVAMLTGVWLLKEMVASKFEIKRMVLFVLYLFFFWLYSFLYSSISTDVFPAMVIFYLSVKALLYPDRQMQKYLFYILVPVFLVTTKLSVGVFSLLICLYFIWRLLKSKQYKALLFSLSGSSLIILCWLIRNVIVSGYLIFPLYQVDLFSFDWKVPQEVLALETAYIKEYGNTAFIGVFQTLKYTIHKFPFIGRFKDQYAEFIIYCFAALSIITFFISLFFRSKRKEIGFFSIWIFISLFSSVLYWLLSAPATRFGIGVLLPLVFLLFVIIFPDKKNIRIPARAGIFVVAILFVYTFTVQRHIFPAFKNHLPQVLFAPLTLDEKSSFQRGKTKFDVYKLNDEVTIYISDHREGYLFDVIPAATCLMPGEHVSRFQDYRRIRARGNRIEDGFWYDTSDK